MVNLRSTLFFVVGFYFWSCGQGDQDVAFAQRGASLEESGVSLHCRLQQLGMQSRLLWDSLSHVLQQELPADIPARERKNMVEIRNAGLLRMFEAYPKLAPVVHDRVDQAEEEDQRLASRMRSLQDSLQQHEMSVGEFLEMVKEQQPQMLPQWQKRLTAYNCE